MSDHHHTERRLEGGRQMNIQLAAAKSGRAVPPIDPSIINEDSFLPSKTPTEPIANSMERYLRLDPQQDAYVVYTRTATQNELLARGILQR